MRAKHHQQAIVADPLQTQLALQQPGNDAALHVQAVGRHFDHVRCVYHVGMGDQRVANRGEQGGHRHRVSRVATDLRPHSGGHQQNGVELLGVFHGPAIQVKNGRRSPTTLQSPQQADFAVLPFPIGIRDRCPTRHCEPDRNLVRFQLLRHGFAQLQEQISVKSIGGDHQLPFVKLDRRHDLTHAPHRDAKSS